MTEISPHKATPEYADGYFDGVQGAPFDTDRGDDEPYRHGYAAGNEAANLFAQHGFRRRGDRFERRFTVR